MANTLTNLIPSLYSSLDVVSRELVGAIPTVGRDSTTDRAAVGQTVTVFQTPAATATDITPGVTPPNDGDQTIGNVTLSITKSRRVPFRWNGEQTLGLNNNGAGQAAVMNDQLTQAIRTLVNEMENDVVAAAIAGASRATGTSGATPFATTLTDPAQLRKILDDNGCPPSDRALIIDTTAGAAMRTLTQLTKANEAGTTMTLRDGELMNLFNLSIHESNGVANHTKGTNSGATTDNAGYAVGTTSLTLASAGTGTIIAGDVVTFAGDSNQYVVVSGSADVSAGGTLVIAAPGLKVAMSAATKAITTTATYTGNVAFTRSAIVLATRQPALPDGGDLAIDRTVVVDPRSGIAFEVAMYPQYRQMQYEVSAAWGVKAIKPQHIALLKG